MGFRDLSEILPSTADEPKCLPILGTTYEFPARVSAETGALLLQIERQRTEVDPSGLGEEVLERVQRDLLGDTYDTMRVAGVPPAMVSHAIATLMVWHLYGQQAAEAAWERMGEAQTPNRAQRRTAASKGSGSKTRSPASTGGTTGRTRKTAARRSPGHTSSSTGR